MLLTKYDQHKKNIKEFNYRGVSLAEMIRMPVLEVAKLMNSRMRRHIARGFTEEEVYLIFQCWKAKNACINPEDKPEVVQTTNRKTIILPYFVGNKIACYNGKMYLTFEIRPEMIGYYIGDFFETTQKKGHGKPGIGATSSSKFTS